MPRNTSLDLYLMPVPEKPLTREAAIEWLRDVHIREIVVVGAGLQSDDPRVRDSFRMLSIDVGTYTKAAALAIEKGKPVKLTSGYEENTLDGPGYLADLARVVGGRSLMSHSTGPFEDVFDELAEELTRRVVAIGDREDRPCLRMTVAQHRAGAAIEGGGEAYNRGGA